VNAPEGLRLQPAGSGRAGGVLKPATGSQGEPERAAPDAYTVNEGSVKRTNDNYWFKHQFIHV
jgi:hypothetical protein